MKTSTPYTFLVPLLLILCLTAPLKAVAADSIPDFGIERPSEGALSRELRTNRTWPHKDMAYRLRAQGDLAGAVRELEAYLAIDPLDDNIRLQLMILQSQQGQDTAVIATAGQLIRNRPDAPLPLMYRAQALDHLGQSDRALADYRSILDMPGASSGQREEAGLALAYSALQTQNFALVLETLQKLPPDSRTEYLSGLALSGLGRHDDALTILEQAAAHAGSAREKQTALQAAAEEAISLGKADTAYGLLHRTTEGQAPSSALEQRLAELAMRTGRTDLAEEHLRKALQLGEKTAHQPLAQLLFDSGKLDQAEQEARSGLQTARTPADKIAALRLLAVIREQRGDMQGAAAAFAELSRLDPGAGTSLSLARTEAAANQPDQARAAYMHSLSTDPTPDKQFEFGLFEARAGQHEHAVQLISGALAGGLASDKHLQAREQLGYSLTALGRRSEADAALRKALELSGTHPRPDLLTALGDNAWEAGRTEEAARYYDRAWQAGGRSNVTLARRRAAALARSGQNDPAISAYLTLADTPELSAAERLAALESAAHLQRKTGQRSAAAATLRQAASLKGISAGKRNATLQGAMDLYLASGNLPQAQELLAVQVRSTSRGPGKARLLLASARLEEEQAAPDWTSRARGLLDDAEIQPGLPTELAADIAEASARIYRLQNRPAEALRALRRAIDHGGKNARTMLELGYLHSELQDHASAKTDFADAIRLGAGDRAWLGLARTYHALDQPGLSLHTLEQAPFMTGSPSGALSASERFEALKLQGYLHEKLQQADQAVTAYEQALELSNDPVVRFRLARALFARGEAGQADQLLRTVSSTDLPADEHIPEIMLRAKVARAMGRTDKAESIYRKADAASPLPDLSYELGSLLSQRGDHEGAARAYARASSRRGTPADHVGEGYELLALRHTRDAQSRLTSAVEHEPDYLAAQQDLGYISMQLGENDRAVDAFMRAIDDAPLRPVPDDATAQSVAEDVYRMRGEIRALTNRWDGDAWLTYTAGQTGTTQTGGTGALERDIVRSSSGVELGWIPPDWGFQDHRIFKVIGRLSWNMEPDSLNFQEDSLSGALGVRYKPFKSQNLNLGLERLFDLSGQGEDNWVARLMYSISDGIDDVRPWDTLWNYSFLFAEADAYLDSPARQTVYAEVRQGLNYRLADNLIVSPFLVGDVKWWIDSPDDVSFYEGGAGLSLRYARDETKYVLPRRSLELLLTYKVGRVFDTDNIREDDINALFATLIFRF